MAALFKRKLTINRGATFRESWSWSAGTPPVPVDLTGCTARMQVRPTPTSDAVMASLTTEDGGIVLGGTAGTIALNIPETITSGIAWLAGVYDFELVYADGTVDRLAEGPVAISPQVTR